MIVIICINKALVCFFHFINIRFYEGLSLMIMGA